MTDLEPPRRTGSTFLTDDELLLMDFVYDCKAQKRHVERGIYSTHANTPYDHSIPDNELPGVLQSLVDRGVLDCEGAVDDGYFGLTRLGGELWETERCPDWSRYVAWPYHGDGVPAEASVIEAFDLGLVETFLSVSENWFGWRDSTPQSTEPYRLVQMAEVFSMPEPKAWTVRCGEMGPGDPWDPSLQTWWSHPRELRLLRDRFP